MLTINNIDHLVGLSANGNRINGFRLDNNNLISGNHYVFVMKQNYNGRKIEVWLNRHKNEHGKYQMFVMGWKLSTIITITPTELKDAVEGAVCVRDCLQLLDKC
jgi:hypothetical protein